MNTLIERRDALAAEARSLIERHTELTGDQLDRFEAIETELELVNRRMQVAAAARTGQTIPGEDLGPTIIRSAGTPWHARGMESDTQTRSRALAAISTWNADDALKQSATVNLERTTEGDVAGLARHVLTYSNPDYVAAFRKFARDPQTFAADLTNEERAAWVAGRDHQRAVLGTSGAVLPSPLDPTIVLTNDGAIDPMRSLARTDTTTAKDKRYVTSAGATFSFDAELAEVSDDTHTEAEVTITTEKAQGWIQASIETVMDQPNFGMEVARLIADGKARLEADKFITGTGTNEPFGIESALAGTASEVDAAGEALTADDIYALLEALPPRFRANAAWQLELSTINFIHRLHNPSGSEPPLLEGSQLLRRQMVENSSIDPYSSVDAAATADNRVAILGDWRNYVILDRAGLSVSFVAPGVLQNAANGRPDGRVGWYAYWRTGADVLTPASFRMLNVATAA